MLSLFKPDFQSNSVIVASEQTSILYYDKRLRSVRTWRFGDNMSPLSNVNEQER